MSETPPVAEIAAPARPRRREWLLRAAFEGTLILLGLLAAFALDEWQDARTREARVEALIAAVRSELDANLRMQEDAAAYNSKVADEIWNQATAGATFVDDAVYESRGLFVRAPLTSAAWATSQNDPALSDVPVPTLLLLAGVYDLQRAYVEDLSELRSGMYQALLQAPPDVRLDGLSQPLQMGGILRDFARRGERLVNTYRAALEQL